MKVQESIDIGAPPAEVWPFLVEPDLILKWYTLLQRFEYTSDKRGGVGTPFYVEEKAAVLMKVNFIVTEWAESERLAFRMTSGNFVKAYAQRWTLEPIQSGSRFTYAEEITMPFGPIGRILGVFGRSSSQAHLREMLARLQALASTA